MLATRERSLLLENLRPPVGYRLDHAVGTSYTLDLTALLAVPLAFTFFNYHDEEGRPTADPVALLEALRRHAERMTLFCQAGGLHVPRPDQVLLAYLEGSVIEVRAQRAGGVFHPKVWLLRFVADGQPVRYRFLCLTRNLTFDRAWDTCLVLDGELTGRRMGFAKNRPLGEFLEALPGLAVRWLAAGARAKVEQMAAEVRRVRFECPGPFQDYRFVPIGLKRATDWPFPQGSRLMVMAPFLAPWAIERCSREHRLDVLISRPEELAALPEEALPEDGTYVLSPGAEMDSREGAEGETPPAPDGGAAARLAGLHAKLWVAESGHHAYLYTGSANATKAAFQANVEFLVELVGSKWKCGIQEILGDENQERQESLRSLLQKYHPPDETEPVDTAQKELDADVARLAREIAARQLTARVVEREEGGPCALSLLGRLPDLPPATRLWTWPVTLPGESRREVTDWGSEAIACFEQLSFEALTAFWAFEIEMRGVGLAASRRFALTVRLDGAPQDRRARLLRSLLKNRTQVLRLLLLLLSDEGMDVSQLVASGEDGTGRRQDWTAGWDEPTLLEALLHSLARDPKRLDQAARLIEDLRRTAEGAELLPPELDSVWAAVWKIRQELEG